MAHTFPWLHRRSGRRALSLALAGWTWLWCTVASAQILPAIPESVLRDPWVLHLALMESLAPQIEQSAPGSRGPLADALATLQVSLGEYETRFDRAIDRLAADPGFGYAATEVSGELARQVADIEACLDAVYALLGVQGRHEVAAAQAAVQELRRMLQARTPFERDVLAGLAGRPQTVELATRWWSGEERAIALKKRVGALRETLEGIVSAH